jgi:hypothetical protein
MVCKVLGCMDMRVLVPVFYSFWQPCTGRTAALFVCVALLSGFVVMCAGCVWVERWL